MNTNFWIATITILILVASYFILQSVLLYLGIGFILSVIGKPLVTILQKIKFKNFVISKTLASVITLLTYYIIIISIILALSPLVYKQALTLADFNPTETMKSIQPLVVKIENTILDITGEKINATEYVQTKISSVVNLGDFSNIISIITSLTGNIFVAFFAISFITFFFLKDGDLIINGFFSIIPKKYQSLWQEIQPQIKQKLTKYFIGISIEVAIVFIMIFVGLWIVGAPYFALIALFAAVLNIIPYIGPILGALIGIIFTVATNYGLDFNTELLPLIGKVTLVFAITQLIDNILLQPIIYSNSISAHPLEIFLVILIAGNMFGIGGMILAIPFYTIIRIIIKEIKNNSSFIQSIYE